MYIITISSGKSSLNCKFSATNFLLPAGEQSAIPASRFSCSFPRKAAAPESCRFAPQAVISPHRPPACSYRPVDRLPPLTRRPGDVKIAKQTGFAVLPLQGYSGRRACYRRRPAPDILCETALLRHTFENIAYAPVMELVDMRDLGAVISGKVSEY